MPSAREFALAFERATARSSNYDEFGSMIRSLGGEPSAGAKTVSIKLNTDKRGSDSRVVEDAVREKFNDDLRRIRQPDALFGKIPVEVKHTTSGFGKLPTDSYGLTSTTEKWYLFVKGSVDRVQDEPFKAFLMRSDELYNQILLLVRGTNQVPLFHDQALESIDPASDNALREIEKEIDDIKGDLSLAILKKAKGEIRGTDDGSMSITKRVGLNRVRFDIKFESKLRKIIADYIND